MSLLNRIAISNGDPSRKIKANLAIATMQQYKVTYWNKSLEAEIRRKRLKQVSPLSKP
jgi:hypothetical protein